MKRILFLTIIFMLPLAAKAEEVKSSALITINGSKADSGLIDNDEKTYVQIEKDDIIRITSEKKIYSIYVVYELKSETGKIWNYGKASVIGENNFLHEYIDIRKTIGLANEVSIQYNNAVKIAEVYVFYSNDIPDYVEKWNTPCEKADLLVIPTHSDDEQLFFAGLIPTYVDRGAEVQVVYFTNHYDNTRRLHEQLHGLYAVGIRNYPIIGIVPDAYSKTKEGAIKNIEKSGLTLDEVVKFQVDMIRRFKPLVIVGHDENGEYGHGQHILNADTLKLALEKSNDENYNPESTNKYGLWDVPKTYLHLYKENRIYLNYDKSLDRFECKTAYEVSKIGYSKHISQQKSWFTRWLRGKNNEYVFSTDIKTYSPNEYGLYRNLIADDINKDDIFEHLTLRKDEIKFIEEENVNATLQKLYSKYLKIEKIKIYLSLIFIIIFISYIIYITFNN